MGDVCIAVVIRPMVRVARVEVTGAIKAYLSTPLMIIIVCLF